MGEKNSHNQKQLRGWHEDRTMNLREKGQDLEETLLRSSHGENDDENHQNC